MDNMEANSEKWTDPKTGKDVTDRIVYLNGKVYYTAKGNPIEIAKRLIERDKE